MAQSKRTLVGVLIVTPGPILWAWAKLSDHYAASWFQILAILLSIILAMAAFLACGPGRFKKRAALAGVVALLLSVTTALLAKNITYTGSVDGSSLPKLAWKSDVMNEEDVAPLKKSVTTSMDEARSLEGLVDSPRFLAPDGVGQWPKELLTARFDNWAASPPEELWRIPMGTGWSGFSVQGQRAVTIEQLGEEETVTCYELSSGQLLWKHAVDARYFSDAPSQITQMAGDGPRSTPLIVGDRVYTHGSTGTVLCLDFESGNKIWQASSIGDLSKLPEWGKSSSLIHLPEENLVVTTGPEVGGPSLIAFDAASGKIVWKFTETVAPGLESENFGGSYSTPRYVTLVGRPQLLSVNATSVTGNDPTTGEPLWRHIWPGTFPKVSQPHIVNDDGETARLLITASYGVGSHLLELSQDFTVTEVWKSTRMKTKFSSALIHQGHAYGLDEAKPACIDLATGNKVWKARADYGYGQNLLVGDHVLVQAEQGHIAVFEANPTKFNEIGRIENALAGLTWNTPTLAGRYLLVRNAREAVCFMLPSN